MTATVDRPTSAQGASPLPYAMPQVNLLPPEIRARRALARVKRRAFAGVAAALVLVLAGYGWSALQVQNAQSELEIAQLETARLTQQQQEYAEVPVVLAHLGTLESARSFGMSTEVVWTPYFEAVFAVMPADFVLTSISLAGATPMLAAVPATDPLQAGSVSTLTFTGRSATVPVVADWIDALDSIPGFGDAWVSAAAAGSKEGVGDHYEVTSTVQVDATAYANRFSLDANGE